MNESGLLLSVPLSQVEKPRKVPSEFDIICLGSPSPAVPVVSSPSSPPNSLSGSPPLPCDDVSGSLWVSVCVSFLFMIICEPFGLK